MSNRSHIGVPVTHRAVSSSGTAAPGYPGQSAQHQQATPNVSSVAANPSSASPPPQYPPAPDSDVAPTLPPRPRGGAGPFLSRSYLSFPPPPRSPNRPPALPPRPQQRESQLMYATNNAVPSAGYIPSGDQRDTSGGNVRGVYYPPPPGTAPALQQQIGADPGLGTAGSYAGNYEPDVPYESLPGYSPSMGTSTSSSDSTARRWAPSGTFLAHPDIHNTEQTTGNGTHSSQPNHTPAVVQEVLASGKPSAPPPEYPTRQEKSTVGHPMQIYRAPPEADTASENQTSASHSRNDIVGEIDTMLQAMNVSTKKGELFL